MRFTLVQLLLSARSPPIIDFLQGATHFPLLKQPFSSRSPPHAPSMLYDVHSSQQIRPMIDFTEINGLCSGSGMGSGMGSQNIFRNPARPGPGEATPPSAAEHAPHTHPLSHTCTHTSRLTLIHPDCHLLGKKEVKFNKLQ